MSYASVRPDSWNFPLFLHVLGAMVLVALLAAAAVVLTAALRSDDRAAARAVRVPHPADRRRSRPTW